MNHDLEPPRAPSLFFLSRKKKPEDSRAFPYRGLRRFASAENTEEFRHGLTLFVSTNYFSNNFVFKAKALLEIAISVPAILLCPRAEKSAFVETKHGYGLKLPHRQA